MRAIGPIGAGAGVEWVLGVLREPNFQIPNFGSLGGGTKFWGF